MKTANEIRQEELNKGCGTKKYEGHYKCRKDNLCPECEAKITENILAVKNEREEVLKRLIKGKNKNGIIKVIRKPDF